MEKILENIKPLELIFTGYGNGKSPDRFELTDKDGNKVCMSSLNGYEKGVVENVKIAGFMHDIGNAINRKAHAEYGGILANELLREMEMPIEDRMTVVAAIANHDESTGGAIDAVSAALIIADKTDVRRSRVRVKDKSLFDIHDRVNYAVTESVLKINNEKKTISLNLQVDEKICTMYEYFDIFLGRMQMCRKAAALLGVTFKLTANGGKIL